LFDIIRPFTGSITSLELKSKYYPLFKEEKHDAEFFIEFYSSLVNLTSIYINDGRGTKGGLYAIMDALSAGKLCKLERMKLNAHGSEMDLELLKSILMSVTNLKSFSLYVKHTLDVNFFKSLKGIIHLPGLSKLSSFSLTFDTINLDISSTKNLITILKNLPISSLCKFCIVMRNTDFTEEPAEQILNYLSNAYLRNMIDMQFSFYKSKVSESSFSNMIEKFHHNLIHKQEKGNQWEREISIDKMSAVLIRNWT
jgi:hypothetical protein